MSAGVDLMGKVAVVTGAGRGVGRVIALELAHHGAGVALAARSADQLRETERAIRADGGVACAIPADVSDANSVSRLKREVEDALGKPTILVNGAGVFGPIQLIKDSDPARWVETLMINAVAAYLTSRAFVSSMLAAGWGRIVNVSSAASLHPPSALNSAYTTSKVALNHITRSLAVELAGTGVTCNVIHPGDVKTDMWADIRDKAERLGSEAQGYHNWVKWVDETGGDPPHKAADLVLRLMSDEAASVNGQFLWIEDSLQKPIPSWGDSAEKLQWDE
jgi:NAD(P)-dependent dehydrogenase (short-subunit alcohol dehydrogenase family)